MKYCGRFKELSIITKDLNGYVIKDRDKSYMRVYFLSGHFENLAELNLGNLLPGGKDCSKAYWSMRYVELKDFDRMIEIIEVCSGWFLTHDIGIKKILSTFEMGYDYLIISNFKFKIGLTVVSSWEYLKLEGTYGNELELIKNIYFALDKKNIPKPRLHGERRLVL